MRPMRNISCAAAILALALSLAACGGSVNNLIAGAAGGKGQVRLVNASPNTAGPLSLIVASTTINSGITNTTPVGVYVPVGAGTQNFVISPTTVSGINKSIAASTFYTVTLLGEMGKPDLGEVIFQDTNSLQNPGSVRFKVNDAAPALGTIDVYVYQGATLPSPATVAGLTAGQDSGSIPSPPGNSYIPPQGSGTTLPSGTYNVAVTAAGSPSTVYFAGSVNMNVNFSYSLTVEDTPSASPTAAQLIFAIDQPPQGSNGGTVLSVTRQRIL